MKPRIPLKKRILEYGMIILGAFILASGFVFFINPYNIVPGGVFGIGIVIHHLIPAIPIGTFGLALNIPLTLLGIRILGPKFGIKTVLGMVLTSAFMDGLTYFIGENDPLKLADDLLLASIFGAILLGVGLGLIFRSRATSGGSDIIAMIFAKFSNLPVGQLLIMIDSSIVLVGLLVFQDWKIPLYSWLVIYITGQVIDIVLKGISYDNALMIVSEKHEEIKDRIIHDLERGGTYLKGEGMFTGQEKNVIFVVVSRRELTILKSWIHQIDKNAFVTVIDTREILGEGFRQLEEDN
ncbi:YitT family protein [Saccharicrinis sp. FJH2]|uniref:YitT family protein n=1 Tax=unclassified Saccharicrinis TaxID=2646859 RepID=UPI0035D4D193